MKRNIYFLLCTFFVFGRSYHALADNPPSFINGHFQSLAVCENSGANTINSLLAALDLDAGQTEVWATVTTAGHGTLAASGTTISTGGVLTPGGFSYSPTAGYIGSDSFRVRITDGTFSDTTTVYVTVNPQPAPITGATNLCMGRTDYLIDAGGGTWSSANTAVVTIDGSSGAATGIATGITTIAYTISTGCRITRTVTVNGIPGGIGGAATPVCSGHTINLSDGGAGTWSSTNTSVATVNLSSGAVTGVSADTVTIIYTLATSCTSTAVVTVNQSPSVITGPSVICMGATGTLGNDIGGGAWSSSNTFIATVAGASVTGASGGPVIITYTVGSCIATKNLTINPIAPITGVTTICEGATTTLFDAIGGGMWSSSIPGVASVSSSGFTNGLAPGTTVITYALPTGCFTTASVFVNPLPSPIGGPTHLCAGQAVTLFDVSGSGTWSSNNTLVATINTATGSLSGVAPGVPVITYAFSTGCKVTELFTVNGLPSPITGPTSVCDGQTVLLSEGSAGGTWSSGNTASATVNVSGFVTGLSPGTTTISYTLATGCTATFNVTANATPPAISGPSSVCQGSSITLSDALGGGIWSSTSSTVAVGSATGNVTGISPDPVTVVYNVGGCTASTVVAVNAIANILGSHSVCFGGSTTLSDPVSGGAWSSDSIDVAFIAMTSGALTSISAGTTNITYTMPTGCTASIIFTVNPAPAPISGANHVCLGAATVLSDSTGGGTWSSSESSVATINIITGGVTALATGIPTITYSFSTGCRVTQLLTINPLPPAIASITKMTCPGLLIFFNDEGGGTWSSSNTSVATTPSSAGLVTGLSAGTTSIIYTLNSCTTSVEVTVNPLPGPIDGNYAMCIGYYANLADSGSGTGTWSTDNGTVVLVYAETGVISGLTAGNANVTYTEAGTGCKATTVVTVKACPVEVKQVAAGSDINVSPNPNTGDFMITGTLGTANDAEMPVVITNMLGQVVYQDKIMAKNGEINQHILLRHNLPNGMYLLSVRTGNENKVFHIVIQQ